MLNELLQLILEIEPLIFTLLSEPVPPSGILVSPMATLFFQSFKVKTSFFLFFNLVNFLHLVHQQILFTILALTPLAQTSIISPLNYYKNILCSYSYSLPKLIITVIMLK